jgi:hypothetical protein
VNVATKGRVLAVCLAACAAFLPGVSATAAPSGYAATKAVPGVAKTSVTVTVSPTASTVTVTTSNAKILADVAGKRLEMECAASPGLPANSPGVSMQDINFGVWQPGATSLTVTLPASPLSGRSNCGTLTDARGSQAPIPLFASFRITAPATVAANRSATADLDPATSFQLDGPTLTVTSTNPTYLKIVQGEQVFGMCFTGVEDVAGWLKNAPYVGLTVTVVGGRVRWAAGADSVTVTLPADISEDVDTCQIEVFPGRPVVGQAFVFPPYVRVSFDAAGAKYLAAVRAHELERIHHSLERAYQLAESARAGASSWPSAKSVMKAVADTNEPLQASYVAYAASQANVTAVGTLYVVGAGTDATNLEFAEIDSYGVTHTLTVTVGGPPHVAADRSGQV